LPKLAQKITMVNINNELSSITIPIDGKLIQMKVQNIEVNQLIPDEDNPRIGLFKDNQLEKKLSQDDIRFALTNKSPEAYAKLKQSIHNNKGIIYPIWVETIGLNSYKVIEGNSRLLIYQDLKNLEPNEPQWKNIISYIFPSGINDDQKNFIRLLAHLRGTNEWDAYEKAKYLYKLSTADFWPISKIEKQTKLNEREINQNIEAYKIMQDQYLPTHQDPYEIAKFSYFVEYVKDNKLKKIMEKRGFEMKDFCEWVGDREKIPTGQDVRKLRDILDDTDASNLFVKNGFEASMEILAYRKPNIIDPFYRDIESVVEKLKSMNLFEIDEISNESDGGKKRMISELVTWSNKILKMIDQNNGK
jgi:hypothetical protein